MVNSGNTLEGTTINLAANLDFNDDNSYKDAKASSEDINGNSNIEDIKTELTTSKGFKPIGNDTNKFKGIFNGNMFTISNLYINRTEENYVGLFGYMDTGSFVSELNINNLKVTGSGSVGGITGYSNGATIKYVMLENIEIEGRSRVGGLVGYSNSGTYNNLIIRADKIKATSYESDVGGVVGYSNGSAISSTLLNVNIIGGSYDVGGFVGRCAQSYGYCTNTSISGVIEGGSITASSGNASTVCGYGTPGGVAYSASGIVINDRVTRKGFTYQTGYQVIGMYDDVLDTFYGGDEDGDNYYFDYENDTSDKIVLKKVDEHSFDYTIRGDGSESNPYILKTESDFKAAAIIGKAGHHYKIEEDIDISTFKHFYQLGTTRNYFSGYIDGNNKTISNMNISGGQFGGFIGYMNTGSIKDIKIETSILKNGYGSGSVSGILIGKGSNVEASNIEINNVTVNKEIESSWAGISVGSMTGNINKIKIGEHEVKGQNGIGSLIGQLEAESTISEVELDISEKTITGASYVGGIAGKTSGTINLKNFSADNLTITATEGYVGGLYGYIGSNASVEGININNLNVSGTSQIGGITGYNEGLILGINLDNVNISGRINIGGIVGYNYSGTIKEATVRGNVTSTSDVAGGAVGLNGAERGWTTGNIYSVLADTTVSGYMYVGGLIGKVGYNSRTTYSTAYGVVEGKSITSTSGSWAGNATGWYASNGAIYTADNILKSNLTGNSGSDGTSYSSAEIGRLSYYGNIKYDTTKPLLESALTGDVNNSGYYFANRENGDIIVVKAGTPPAIVDPIDSCTGADCQGCRGNCEDDEEYRDTGLGTCPEDTEPPTCTFNYIVPVINGIRVSFNCTDNSGAPEVASLFNSVNKNKKTYAEILAVGSIKGGTISGNTKNILSTWTTAYEGNKPEPGRCYYYQYGAKDSCGNWTTYVTDKCWYGFSN